MDDPTFDFSAVPRSDAPATFTLPDAAASTMREAATDVGTPEVDGGGGNVGVAMDAASLVESGDEG